MIDELYDRTYRAGRTQLNATLSSAVVNMARAIAEAFTVLNRIEYAAPWESSKRKTRVN